MNNLTIVAEPSSQSCGALVRDANLAAELSAETIAQLRSLWLQYQVIGFPDQPMAIDQFKRFALAFGPHGDDPYLGAMPGHAHVVEIKCKADETTAPLGELFEHQARPEFVYRHRWQADMVVLWDNRCLVHAATGGYQGHRRLLRRITIAERAGARGKISTTRSPQ